MSQSLALSLLILFVSHLVAAVGSFFAMEDTVKALEEKVVEHFSSHFSSRGAGLSE